MFGRISYGRKTEIQQDIAKRAVDETLMINFPFPLLVPIWEFPAQISGSTTVKDRGTFIVSIFDAIGS